MTKKKKRTLGGDGKGVVFRRPGEESDDDDDDVGPNPDPLASLNGSSSVLSQSKKPITEEPALAPVAVVETAAIIIHDED